MFRPPLARIFILTGLSVALASSALADLPAGARGDIDEALLRIHEFDRTLAVDVELQESLDPNGAKLFADLPEGTILDPSYDATFEFCQKFDPYNRSDAEVSDEEIEAYLEPLMETGPLLEAFYVTGRSSMDDLKNAWFRGGRGFEHVVCGETGRGTKLGGYHFWYMHYRYERDGRGSYEGANYGSLDPQAGMADTHIVTGNMSIDPDGPGGEAWLSKKPRGGFTVGHSVSAILAIGHLAIYGNKFILDPDIGGSNRGLVETNVNGKTYPWTFHRQGGSVRTLWPRYVP